MVWWWGIVDIIQQISLKYKRGWLSMSSPPSSPPSPAPFRIHQKGPVIAKKSRATRRQHSFVRASSLPADLSSQSDCSDDQQKERCWSAEEERQLLAAFGELGADWRQVAVRLEGRTALESKGHFAQILRKVVQKANQQEQLRGRRQTSIISRSRIGLAIEAAAHHPHPIADHLLQLAQHSLREGEEKCSNIEQILVCAKTILLDLKRTKNRKRSSKASTVVPTKLEGGCQDLQRGYASDSSSAFQELEEQDEPHSILLRHDFFADEQVLQAQPCEQEKGVIVQQSEQGIKELLRSSGVLEVEVDNEFKNVGWHDPISSSQNLNNESYQHFYQQSELERDCYWKKNCSLRQAE